MLFHEYTVASTGVHTNQYCYSVEKKFRNCNLHAKLIYADINMHSCCVCTRIIIRESKDVIFYLYNDNTLAYYICASVTLYSSILIIEVTSLRKMEGIGVKNGLQLPIVRKLTELLHIHRENVGKNPLTRKRELNFAPTISLLPTQCL